MSTVWDNLVEKVTPLGPRTLTINEQEMYAIVHTNQRLNELHDIVDGLQELIQQNKEILQIQVERIAELEADIALVNECFGPMYVKKLTEKMRRKAND
jgi:hypothetical protein